MNLLTLTQKPPMECPKCATNNAYVVILPQLIHVITPQGVVTKLLGSAYQVCRYCHYDTLASN